MGHPKSWTGSAEIEEPVPAEALQAHCGIEAFRVGIVGRLVWPDEVKRDAIRTRPENKFLRRELDDRFHETARLQLLDLRPQNAAVSAVAYDSNFGSARLVCKNMLFASTLELSRRKIHYRSEARPAAGADG